MSDKLNKALNMKNLKLSHLVGISALTASLAFLPATLPSAAQTGTGTGTNDTTTGQVDGYNNTRAADDDGFDWGWLGLLGLLGLAGLAGRKNHDDNVRYRDPAEPVSRTGYRE